MALPWAICLKRSIAELADLAQRLVRGDYAARARLKPGDSHAPLADAMNALAARVEQTVGALSDDRAQLASILAHIVEAVVAVDAEGRVVAANPALRALLGAETLALGRPFAETLRHPKLETLLGSVLKEGRARVEEVSLFTPQETHFEVHAVPLREGDRRGARAARHHAPAPAREYPPRVRGQRFPRAAHAAGLDPRHG